MVKVNEEWWKDMWWLHTGGKNYNNLGEGVNRAKSIQHGRGITKLYRHSNLTNFFNSLNRTDS